VKDLIGTLCLNSFDVSINLLQLLWCDLFGFPVL
jgi:hypothetical protein